ncbi:hypothetical protein SPONN_1311 [uncultured Candidatus Thioglobus sp.]|nr:hypothetical protein SPONN_1311 [uncultured Candidatus Thioglobus sp.]
MKFEIPDDVTEHVKNIFASCNNSVTEDLSTFPAIHEESLDSNLISCFSRKQQPVKLASNWIVRIDAHFIGGGRHFGTWEVADIGLMMVFRRKGKVVKSKLALLQSKKLYANTLKYNEESKYVRNFGLGRLIVPDEEHAEIIEDKLLVFKEASKYQAFRKEDDQQKTMGHFERRWGTDLYYLFYNPVEIPLAIKMPVEVANKLGTNQIGCRVLSKKELDAALKKSDIGYSPSYKYIKDNTPDIIDGVACEGGWKLEDFAADLMLQCKAGLVDDSPNYESLAILMNQKQRPISAAVSITFDMDE